MKSLKTIPIILFAPALLLWLILGSLAQGARAKEQPVVSRGEQLAPAFELSVSSRVRGGDLTGFQNLSGLETGHSPELTEEKLKQQFGQKSGSLQMPFIKNEGQVDGTVAFYAKTFGGTVYVTHKGEIVYSLPKVEETTASLRDSPSPVDGRGSRGVRAIYEGESPPSVSGVALKKPWSGA